MQRLLFILILGASLFFLFNACQQDEPLELDQKEYPNVDQKLWVYFERFEEEGLRHGQEIDLIERGITATIEPITQEHVGGLCNYFSNHANQLVIDDYIWANTSEFQKELIIFHELGHCYLFREHDDRADSDGFCISLMRSGNSSCIDRYNASTRQAYLDELFNP